MPSDKDSGKADDRRPVPHPLIRSAREQKHWTQSQLARKLNDSIQADGDQSGFDGDSVSRWERGARNPDLRSSLHLQRVLEKNAEELGLYPYEGIDGAPTGREDGDREADGDNGYLTLGPAGPVGQPEPPPADGGLVGQEATPNDRHRQIRMLSGVAGVAVVVAVLVAAMALLQVGLFARSEVLVIEGVPRPGAPTTAKPKSAPVNCPAILEPATHSNPDLDVVIDVASDSEPCWTQVLAPVVPGATIHYLITYKNTSASWQRDVGVGVNLAPGVNLVPNSTWIYNLTTPKGDEDSSNRIALGGISIGSYGPGEGAYVRFAVDLPLSGAMGCGLNDYRSVGVVQPAGFDQVYNTVIVDVNKGC